MINANVWLFPISRKERNKHEKHIARVRIETFTGGENLNSNLEQVETTLKMLMTMSLAHVSGYGPNNPNNNWRHFSFTRTANRLEIFLNAMSPRQISLFRRHVCAVGPLHNWKVVDKTRTNRLQTRDFKFKR